MTSAETTPTPFEDLRVVVTRPRHQADALGRAFEERGAKVVYFPTIEIQDPPSWERLDLAIRKLADGLYSWVVFTSSNGVERFFQRLDVAELDARALGRTRVAAVGSTTERVLREHGIRADFVPQSFTGEALAETMGRGLGRVLIPRAEVAPHDMVEILESAGFIPDEVVAYRTVVASRRSPEAKDIASGDFDVVTFLSGSAATGFVGVFGPPAVLDLAPSSGDDGTGRTVAAIGPKTAEVATDLGFRVDVVAPDHTAEGLIEAVAAHLGRNEDDPGSEPPAGEERIDGEVDPEFGTPDAGDDDDASTGGRPSGSEGGTIGR